MVNEYSEEPSNVHSAKFKIKSKQNIIYIGLEGVWTVQQDLSYLTQFTQEISHYRGRSWAVFVNMRNWTLPQEVFDSPYKRKIILSRKNQIGEGWLVNNPKQGDNLLPFFDKVNFDVFRSQSLQRIKEHFSNLKLNFDIDLAQHIISNKDA